eukprot:gnl/TRDRNA2_/TRDRNA2_181701_c0_seq1.p1 gnl/TRDRNA2_/TRDRNA2_181701_c0~~gnl/TRDRNA2_/TRDRNA2_181701_c0_seq1.p1  ORF type:complete len:579 (+),score=101.87 gnl/TRDRNA2_/TRDRNA2_181701_c0_seq1:50-1786(+)
MSGAYSALDDTLVGEPPSNSVRSSTTRVTLLALLVGSAGLVTLLIVAPSTHSWVSQEPWDQESAMAMAAGMATAARTQRWQGWTAPARSTRHTTAAMQSNSRAMSPFASYGADNALRGSKSLKSAGMGSAVPLDPWGSLESEVNGWMDAARLRAERFGPRGSLVKVNAEARAAAGGPAPVTLVLGGDGFCGWPTALHLSENGHKVVIVDNLLRRKIDDELGTQSLTPICSPEERVAAWKEVSDKDIEFVKTDVSESLEEMMSLFAKYKPDNIIHFAEIRSAPYSMKSANNKKETVRNNVMGVHNVLISMLTHCPDAHLIHLGTMGVYGYNYDGNIPEGYINATMYGKEREIVAPYDPGSVYHSTKCLDNVLFNFYVKNDRLKITDLHQGVVWGVETPETSRDPRLVNRIDVDSDYGTVLNRFAVQAAMGLDITPYGTGGQKRAFINIADTARCIRLATENPPNRGDRVQIFNQVAESHRVRDLAALMEKLSPSGAKVTFVPNPRNEKAENELSVLNENYKALGWNPVELNDERAKELIDTVLKHKDRLTTNNIAPSSFWGAAQEEATRKAEEAKSAAR